MKKLIFRSTPSGRYSIDLFDTETQERKTQLRLLLVDPEIIPYLNQIEKELNLEFSEYEESQRDDIYEFVKSKGIKNDDEMKESVSQISQLLSSSPDFSNSESSFVEESSYEFESTDYLLFTLETEDNREYWQSLSTYLQKNLKKMSSDEVKTVMTKVSDALTKAENLTPKEGNELQEILISYSHLDNDIGPIENWFFNNIYRSGKTLYTKDDLRVIPTQYGSIMLKEDIASLIIRKSKNFQKTMSILSKVEEKSRYDYYYYLLNNLTEMSKEELADPLIDTLPEYFGLTKQETHEFNMIIKLSRNRVPKVEDDEVKDINDTY